MTRLIQLLGRPGAVAVILVLVVGLIFCSWQDVAVPAAVKDLITALVAGSLYGMTPPHVQAELDTPPAAAGLVENGDAEGGATS